MFGALLDLEKGGHFSVRPSHTTYATKQLHFPDTACLVTRFMTEAGAGEVIDFMPVTGSTATDRHRPVPMLRCVRGSMAFEVDIAPRFDYGRKPHTLHISEHGAVFA
ncbi:trehalase-like domain-containing protein [Streptomyces sp. NPDC057445]|uniref:trehalase-like domain-containing protein n=1 Tax=Streptomyces sp. NPDC057445 TaxID=3346136 RepID=UPI00369EF6A1